MFSDEDLNKILESLKFQRDNLVQYRTWLGNENGKMLPDTDIPVKQVNESINNITELMFKIIKHQALDNIEKPIKIEE